MHPATSPDARPRRWLIPTLAIALLAGVATTGAVLFLRRSSTTNTGGPAVERTGTKAGVAPAPRLRTSGRVKALDFAVSSDPAKLSQNAITTQPPILSVSPGAAARADSPAAAVTSFMNAAIAGDVDTAWALVGSADQVRLGYKQRITDQVNASGWKGFSVTSTAGDRVIGTITQTPKISDIDGVIAEQGNLRVQTIKEATGYRVLWSRKSIVQMYPELSAAQDDAVSTSVGAWIRSRQACAAEPAHEYTGGLIGVVGLANELCKSNGDVVLGGVSDFESLDEPQPIVEAFGGNALQWARVVPITSPIRMDVVVAPRGTEWIVVAVQRPTITKS